MLAHVHVYFRVITGESLAKNYRLPLEQMLLQNTRELDSVRVPTQGAELVTFTVRMMMKHTVLAELLLLARGKNRKAMQQEATWLTRAESPSENDPLARSVELAHSFLTAVDSKLFAACLTALTTPTSLFRRIVLGRRLRKQLRPYARHSAARAWVTGVDIPEHAVSTTPSTPNGIRRSFPAAPSSRSWVPKPAASRRCSQS